MCKNNKVYQHGFRYFKHLQNVKRSILDFLLCLPTPLLALALLLLLVYNGFSVFYVQLPSPPKAPPEPANISPENLAENSLTKPSSAALMYAVKEGEALVSLKTQLPLLQKPATSTIPVSQSSVLRPRKARRHKALAKILRFGSKSEQFPTRIRGFFKNSTCKVRFFMTWISSLASFGERESFAVQSLFKSHPTACLVIVSNSMASKSGSLILKSFLDKGFKVIAIKPDFDYLFSKTPAETWFESLKEGKVDPGGVSLGQNLSNLLRLALLYKFGGIYIDTDVIVLKSFAKLRNAIGAQTIDLQTGNWSRLNNAVLIFDKGHSLLFKFIEEFALTFDGNKWGHNGPYLVSRVVSRVNGRPGFDNFMVLPPSAFYPVDWSKIGSLFRGPGDELHTRWIDRKLEQIRTGSLAVHLWNKQSKSIEAENGSVINHIMLEGCIFCNSSRSSLI